MGRDVFSGVGHFVGRFTVHSPHIGPEMNVLSGRGGAPTSFRGSSRLLVGINGGMIACAWPEASIRNQLVHPACLGDLAGG